MPLGLALIASGCVRVLELGETPESPASESGVNPDQPAPVCVPEATLGYSLPSARWGLAALYASRRLEDRPSSELRLSPNFFLASGWQISGFGCADYGPPWLASEAYGGDLGCLGLPEGTVWSELCKLFPGDYACEGYPGTFVGDVPEADALALAGFALAAHALVTRFRDPEDWYRTATDPLAVERLTAVMHYRGPWAGEVPTILDECADDVEACLAFDLLNHVSGVAEKLGALDGAGCHDAPLDPADVTAFVDGLAAARPRADWSAAHDAALGALTGDGFATEAPAVLDAIEAAVPLPLACPELELYTWYRLPCP